LALLEGRLDEAQRLRAEARLIGARAQDPEAGHLTALQVTCGRFEQRRFADIDPRRILERGDRPQHRAAWAGFAACVLWEQGRPDAARAAGRPGGRGARHGAVRGTRGRGGGAEPPSAARP
jgi:hypothetical protein